MDKQTWTIAGIISAVVLAIILIVSFTGKNAQIERQQTTLQESGKALEEARAEATKLQEELAELRQNLEYAEARMKELEALSETALQSRRSLEDEMRAALESKDVTISKLQGKLTVNILDRVLFDSGEAQLKPEGEAVLRKVAKFLTDHPALKVHVIGHTDNVPIKPSARSRFASNWELSLARASAAVRFLSEQAGVDPRRLGAVGYGEFRPIADNTTPEGRARNRRIAITVLPDELAGADSTAPNANKPAAPVNSPAEPAQPPKD